MLPQEGDTVYLQGSGQGPVIEVADEQDDRCGPVIATWQRFTHVHFHRLLDGRLLGPFADVNGIRGICPNQKLVEPET